MRLSIILGLAYLAIGGRVHATDSAWHKKEFPLFNIFYTAADSMAAKTVASDIDIGCGTVRSFFHSDFKQRFNVYLFPNRSSLNSQWRKDWNMPNFNSECWMVASGVAGRLDILSPLDWKNEACDHDASDTIEIQQIVTHELVHVFHGQHNPTRTFDGMDDLSWFVEGLACFVSGQLSEERIDKVKSRLRQGNAPEKLSFLWTGNDKYGQAGSFVEFLEGKFGRETIIRLLPYTDLASILAFLKTDEASLLSEWKENMLE